MRILFFSPYAGFWKHYIQDIVVADSLKKKHEVFFVGCNTDINFSCMYINSKTQINTINENERKKYCNDCINKKKINLKKNKIFEISDYLNKNEYNDLCKKLENLSKEKIKNFCYKKINIGKIALYDFILLNKLNDINKIDEKLWNNYLLHFKSTLKVTSSIDNLIKNNQFDLIITSNNLYSINQCVVKIAELNNIKCLSIAPGKNFFDRLSKISIFKPILVNETEHHVKKWDQIDRNHIKIKDFDNLKNYIISLFEADHKMIYSPKVKKKVDFKFKFNPGNKKILVILSGADENLSAIESGNDITSNHNYKRVFKDQLSWIEKLLNYAQNNLDKDFIFRPHPRDWPNINSKYVISQNFKFFKNLERRVLNQKNVFLDLPDYNYSIYNYLEFIDLCLTYGSTAGLEFGLFGIPVLDGDIFKLGYPPQIEMVYSNENEFFSLLSQVETYKKNISYSVNYFRWLNLLFEIDTIDINSKYMKKSDLLTFRNILIKGFFKVFDYLNINLEEKFDILNLSLSSKGHKIINYLVENKFNNIFDVKIKLNHLEKNSNIQIDEKERIKTILTELSIKYFNKNSSYQNFINNIYK